MSACNESQNHQNLTDEVGVLRDQSSDRELTDRYRGTLKRLRNELAFEMGFVLLGVVLAISWNAKIGFALAILCLRFGVAHFVTAWIVARCDPDRWHGLGVAALFIAFGLLRAAFAASVVLAVSVLAMPVWLMIRPGKANQAIIFVSLGTGFLCAYGYLLLTLPLAIFAFCISWFSGTRLSFAAGVTQLRLCEGHPEKPIQLDIGKSLGTIAIASGSAVTVIWVFVLGVIAPPNIGTIWGLLLLVMAFLIPFIWGFLFVRVVCPKKQHVR